LGFSGGGSSQTKPHTHNSLSINDGGALQFDNITQATLTTGDITYSDGTHLQRLAIGGVGDQLVVNGAATGPEWAASVDPHNSGMVVCWAGTNANIPAGWLLCDGSSIATASYVNLFAALGYVYGGAGANFNLPDLVTRFPKGSATQTATTGGNNAITLSESQMPDHTHVVSDPGHYHAQWTYNGGSGPVGGGTSPSGSKNTSAIDTQSATTGITIANTGGSTSFDNQPAFLELQYIIKT